MIQSLRFHLCRLWPFATRLNKSTATMSENLFFASPFLKITPWGWNRDDGKVRGNQMHADMANQHHSCSAVYEIIKIKHRGHILFRIKASRWVQKTNNKCCQYLFPIQSPLSKLHIPPRCSVNKLIKREETASKGTFNCTGMPGTAQLHRLNQSIFAVA